MSSFVHELRGAFAFDAWFKTLLLRDWPATGEIGAKVSSMTVLKRRRAVLRPLNSAARKTLLETAAILANYSVWRLFLLSAHLKTRVVNHARVCCAVGWPNAPLAELRARQTGYPFLSPDIPGLRSGN